ncbi:MAG: hypothetical protein V2A34_10285 [Lentisphaerota bacterium]
MNTARNIVLAMMIMLGLMVLASGAQDTAIHKAPTISHDPVKVAVRGQPLSIIANVRDDEGEVKSVSLYYTLSKNAAPFKSVMQSSGANMYYGSIPAHLLSGTPEISYYLEAVDHTEEMAETPWYLVTIKDAQSSEPPPKPKPAPKPEKIPATPAGPSAPAAEKNKGTSLMTIGLIAGGAAALVGGAVYLANKDSSSDNGDDPAQKAGDYVGVTRVFYTVAGQDPVIDVHDMKITIDSTGLVTSETLHQGTPLQARLSGSGFLMVASVDEPSTGRVGQVNYLGNVVGNEIIGSVTGSATEPAGQGKYDGTFTAIKQ